MDYIVWDAGDVGNKAAAFLGYNRIRYFADEEKEGSTFLGKEVISVKKMLECARKDDYIIVIASVLYQEEMKKEITRNHIKSYFVFQPEHIYKINDFLPFYDVFCRAKNISYTEIISKYNIYNYNNILIYGANEMLPYLISEIKFQAPDAKVNIAKQTVQNSDVNCLDSEIRQFDIKSNEYDCIILNVKHDKDNIRNEIEKTKTEYDIIDLFSVDDFESLFYHPELEKYMNKHKGKRCFIVATGPSLRIEDLEKLYKNNEICFSMNKIYRSYNKTNWRADYIGISDPVVMEDVIDEIDKVAGELFISDSCIHHVHTLPRHYQMNKQLFHVKCEEYSCNLPRFSGDITKGTYWGYTVTYDFCLQFAAYMGFSEIYLLGVDNTSNIKVSDKNNHFIENYFYENEKTKYNYICSDRDKINLAYKKAEEYSRMHGFRIYNATRGGELEAFERVDFDSLFDE